LKLSLVAPTLLAIVVLTVAQGGAADAHANYARSTPAPNARLDAAPQRILIGFSEAPDPKQSGIDLLASDGRTVASGEMTTGDPTELALAVPPLDNATYLVAWHTVSAVDGDPAHGYFAFAVGPLVPSSGQVQLSADVSGTHLVLTIAPGKVGPNEYRVHVTDGGGAPLANVTRVRLRIQDLDRDLGTSLFELPATGSDYLATGMDLGLAGRFSVTVEVRRRDILDDLTYPFTVTVSVPTQASPSVAASPTSVAAESPTASPREAGGAPPLVALAIAAIVVVIIGGAGLVLLRRAWTDS
jgi:methionine-rich copper-binding protein CopC